MMSLELSKFLCFLHLSSDKSWVTRASAGDVYYSFHMPFTIKSCLEKIIMFETQMWVYDV